MIACDRCKNIPAKKTNTVFTKDQTKLKVRTMLNIRMDLCENCISEFMKLFGETKFKFLKGKDEPPTDRRNDN